MTRKPRFELRSLLFVLPNLFTVSSIFCGFYAIILCMGEATGEQLYRAALMIFFASFFDAFDGRVARMTKTQSDFGVQLDSLADLVSFGVAPGILAYKWGLAPLGLMGIVIAFIFPTCGALRLARFNVLAMRENHDESPSRFFVGLPIPFGAAMLVSLVIAHHKHFGREVIHHYWVGFLVLVVGLLMVSNVRYRTFKDLGFSKKSATAFLILLAGGVLVAIQVRASFALVGYVGIYVAMGLFESLLRIGRRAFAPATAEGSAAELSEDLEELLPAEEDEEVFS